MQVHLTLKSSNKKTGPIPVTTTEAGSCPESCPYRRTAEGPNGCYADYGPLNIHWKRVTDGRAAVVKWDGFLTEIRALPEGQLWRHNQAGDLPHNDEVIDAEKVGDLVEANSGRKGFTFSHHDMTIEANREVIKKANEGGFTVNLSADTLEEVDQLADLEIGPVVVTLPADQKENLVTEKGRPVILCLNVTHGLTCEECKVCAIGSRKSIVGFPAHGTGKRKVEAVFNNGRG